jgi:carbon monoxide dehydrogenase subunit G
MAPIVSTIDISAPQDEVFDYVTDPAMFIEWQSGVVSGHVDGGTSAVGSRCVATRRIGGRERESTSQITKLEPPTSSTVHGIDGDARCVDVTAGAAKQQCDRDCRVGEDAEASRGACSELSVLRFRGWSLTTAKKQPPGRSERRTRARRPGCRPGY